MKREAIIKLLLELENRDNVFKNTIEPVTNSQKKKYILFACGKEKSSESVAEPRANSSLFMLLAGRPSNIKKNSRGQFWISMNKYNGTLYCGSLLASYASIIYP
ncbi:hypothetical protein MTR_5g093640 [Medicago truncatula]|uniref:Uncharacterized protein n=1 Tax=Medicago truncatula TaxID=3880 RepID=G7K8N1_MEDTR|nr:hypothetical protein MTR_5g093640 [Medicago truncatula]